MNGRPLNDAEISSALRAHLPERAYPGLRERILDATETTGQQRALPSVIGALSEADPVVRWRSLLIAAALLVALALASVAAVGALRLMPRDPVKDLSLETPAEVQAFVLSSHDRMPQLPPVAITTLRTGTNPPLDSDATKDRIYVDRSGAVRLERYASADATEPVKSMILSGSRFGQTVTVGPNTVWVENDEAIGEDPRVYILTTSLTGLAAGGGSGCEMTRDSSEAGNGTAATGWRYVGADSVAGRRAQHLACAGNDVWIDEETRLILRVRHQDIDDAGSPIPGTIGTTEVTKLEFGEQPAALFVFAPPDGVAAMSSEEYAALCPGDTIAFQGRPCAGTPRPAEVTPTPTPEPSPTPVVRPNRSDCAVPPRDPSEPAGPLAWSQASLTQDWPAPVRTEPAGGASVMPMPPTYIDPSGDTGSDVLPCIDIRDLTVGTYRVSLNLVANPPPGVDPSKAWIAYGVVVDDNRDGVPDWRYGIDNMAATAGNPQADHRAWRADLHTGRTESDAGRRPYRGDYGGLVGTTFFGTSYPSGASGSDAGFRFGQVSDTTGGEVTLGIKVDMPIYTWASVIVDGRVVATDYAPDTGWLLPTPGATSTESSATDPGSGGPDIWSGGTYVLKDPFPVRLSMNVTAGWTIVGDPRFYHAGGVTRDYETGLRFVMVDTLTKDACAKRAGAIDGRATVDDLVTFLARLPLVNVQMNTAVTLDGYRGKYLEFKRTAGEIDCGWGGLDGWPASSPSARDEDDRVWILDIDGVPLVIDAFSSPGDEDGRAEVQRIVESIDIGP